MPDLRAILERTLGDSYTFERELVAGGMSRVFVAMDRNLGRQIIFKVLSADVAAEVSVERFRREIHLAARLQHPHIVPLLSAGEIAGAPYFTMPFVEGETLRSRLARVGEFPVADAVAAFLAGHQDFHAIPAAGPADAFLTADGYLRLTPRTAGTDGFFVGVLRRDP